MSIPSPFQQYHFYVILIWWHSSFKLPNESRDSCLKRIFQPKELHDEIIKIIRESSAKTSIVAPRNKNWYSL